MLTGRGDCPIRIIAIANQKGGCGKTTTAINLSASLAFLQKRVLLVDLDPQGHATCGLGVKSEFLEKTSYDLFQKTPNSISDLILPLNEYLSLIPTHVILSLVEQEWMNGEKYTSDCLANRIAQLREPYDYVIIDSPPHIGLLTSNALSAAGEVIIPIEPSFFSLHGLAKIFETIDSIQKAKDRKIRIHALMTRFEKRIRLAREIQEEVHKHFKEQTFLSTIDENIRLKEAAASGKSIVDFDRLSVGFRNYMGLAIEVIERGLIWQTPELLEQPKESGNANAEVSGAQISESPTTDRKEFERAVVPAPAEVRCSLGSHEVLEASDLGPKKVLGGILFSFLKREASSVLIAGDFNRWVAEPLLLVNEASGLWQKIVPVGPGTYHYKFLVNDLWQQDPFNQTTEGNRYGGVDSVITIDGLPPAYENGKETKTGTC